MTSNFNAVIEIEAEEKTNAIFDSVNVDNKFYPENPTNLFRQATIRLNQ